VNLVDVPPAHHYLRGDANDDGTVNIADPIYTINERVREGPGFNCDRAADSNGDEMVDLSDAMYTIHYRFLGGAPPPAPFGEECADEARSDDDTLSCDSTSCGD